MKKDRCGWTDPFYRQCKLDVDHKCLCDYGPPVEAEKTKKGKQ